MDKTDNEIKYPSDLDIDVYRKMVQTYLSMNLYGSAVFWADKVATLSCNNPKDIYWLAHCMFLLKQYHRAAHIIRSKELEKTYKQCNYLVVRCLYEAREYSEALRILNLLFTDNNTTQSISAMDTNESFLKDNEGFFDDSPKNQVIASILLLKGHLLEAMDNRGLAADCYKLALQHDVHCYEAFEALIKHQMLSADEERQLLNSIPISTQCTKTEASVIRLLYESKLKKYHTVENVAKDLFSDVISLNKTIPELIIPLNHTPASSFTINTASTPVDMVWTQDELSPSINKLQESLDLVVANAERLYYNCEYQKCMEITERVLKTDPFHNDCLPVHIGCLVELKNSNSLFSLAHKLVDLYPDLAISWYAVGCYYYVIGKSDPARRFLSKATSLDKLFGPAWLAYGHSFAVDNEHDQAMAAYFKASQLMKGYTQNKQFLAAPQTSQKLECHLPLLYIGLECGLTNNIRLAEKFFQQAQNIAPDDPFVMHEMGVVAFQSRDYKAAEKHFLAAYNKVKTMQDSFLVDKWEALLNNLGHTYRKLKKYEESLKYHHKALVLSPLNASSYSAIGYANALMGRTQEAADWFHKALGLRRDDTFSTTMLSYLMEQLAEEGSPFLGCPEFVPDFVPSRGNKSQDESSILNAIEDRLNEESNQREVSGSSDMSMSFDIDKTF